MYITFQCDPCAGVPQDLRKTADLKSGLHTPCRKTMPQSMEMNIFQITIFRVLPHAILQGSGLQEIPCFSGQNICFRIICSPFVTELFKQANAKGINTALDTSGIFFNRDNTEKIDELLKYTSIVLLDIKHIDDEEHKKLTKHSNKNILAFAKYLSDIKKPMWVRHVVVPGITFKEEYLTRLGVFLAGLHNIAALDVLPYHDMAVPKYENLGIEYPLKGVPPLSHEQAMEARNIIMKAYKAKKEEG